MRFGEGEYEGVLLQVRNESTELDGRVEELDRSESVC